jgi:L-alanine-DL-glutamate epimerase-like enolase superfamily enzyme
MDRIRNQTVRTKMGMKEDILREIEEHQLRWYGHVMRMEDCRMLDRLQNRTHRGKGGAADQSTHGRMGLRTACKEETLRVKNISIESSGGKTIMSLG